ncbi:MAG: PTS sorbitol transporter [Chloroflexota bacterium]
MSFMENLKKVLFGNPPEDDQPTSVAATQPAVAVAEDNPPAVSDGTYRRVRIERGVRGWGGPLVIAPKPGKDLIYSVTGGGIHPVAQKIADLTGGKPFDGFKSKADFDEIAVAVIDCGGTARIGVYPMKGVLTIDIHGATPSGPLMKFITEDLFVSGISEEHITLLDEE